MGRDDRKKSPLDPPLSKGGKGSVGQGAVSDNKNITPLTRRSTKSGKLYSTDDLKKRHLIYNGRHLPYNPDNTEKARRLRKNMTPEERLLW